ncbi:unnamed protein product, partial [Gadus morhua 'NCC']
MPDEAPSCSSSPIHVALTQEQQSLPAIEALLSEQAARCRLVEGPWCGGLEAWGLTHHRAGSSMSVCRKEGSHPVEWRTLMGPRQPGQRGLWGPT